MDDASLRDPQKGRSGLLFECLERPILLPKDMHELQAMRKHEVFLSLRKDLVKVCTYPCTYKHAFLGCASIFCC